MPYGRGSYWSSGRAFQRASCAVTCMFPFIFNNLHCRSPRMNAWFLVFCPGQCLTVSPTKTWGGRHRQAPSPAARPPYSCFVRKIEVLGISTVVAGGRCGKLRWLDSVLAPTHHLRYVREERATRCYDFDPQYAKRLDQSVEQRVAPCFQTNTQMSSGVATRLYYKAFAETRSCPRNQQ